MRKRTLIVFGAVTAATVAAAIAVQPGGGLTTGREGERMFPGLEERINEAAAITVRSGNESVEVVRGGEDDDAPWVVADKFNYPAKTETVKKTLVVIARLETLEPKTRRPELYHRLQVGDPAAEDADSALVTVTGEDGGTMAEVIVGKRQYAYAAVGPEMVYVRRPGEARAWLAKGGLEPDAGATAWLDTRITDVPRTRLHDIRLEGAEGLDLHIRRPSPETEDWEVVNLPEGRKLASQGKLRSVGSSLFGFDLEDVAPAERKAEALDDVFRTATFRTFDGLVVTVRLAGSEEDPWATVEAAYDAALREQWADALAAAKDQTGPDDEPVFSSAEAVQEEAETITRRTMGWAYVPPKHKVNYMLTSLDDVTEPEAAETN